MALRVPVARLARDPSAIFTAAVIALPLAYADGLAGALAYATTPMMIAAKGFLGLVLYTTHSAPCVELSTTDFRIATWFLVNGVYFNLFLDVVSGQFQMMDEMTRQYNHVEPRYAVGVMSDAGASVFMTSMLELFFQSPLAILAYYGFHRRKPYRHLAALVVSVLHATGVWYFYVPEVIQGFKHLGGWPSSVAEAVSVDRVIHFWFAFWFCGLLWLYVPYKIAQRSWAALQQACADKDKATKEA